MVRTLWLTAAALLMCAALFIFTDIYIREQFGQFSGAVEILYDKTENGTATPADGEAVRMMWKDKKSMLHIFVPHNDISYIDYWLNEAYSYINSGMYTLALGNLEVVREIAAALPDNYTLKFGNIF